MKKRVEHNKISRTLAPVLLLLAISGLPALAEEDSGLFNYSSFLGQELLIQFPAFNKENIFGPGIGGSLIYENYALNHLFNKQKTLPGIIWGITSSFFNFLPEMETNQFFGDSTLVNVGLYTGFQFYFPLTDTLAFSPTLFGGGRYYLNLHYFIDTLHIAKNPIIIGGINLNFIINRTVNTCLSGEYQLYYEKQPAHTIQLALRTGWYL